MWAPTWSVIFQKHSWMQRHAFTMMILLMCLKSSHGSSCGDAPLPVVEIPRDGACGDMDIRNSVRHLRMLENCTVIEGSLHISLIDYVPQEEYNKYSFPLLREITGHLMMFRVFGLQTLRNLFPNLTVIRGQTRFFKDYALVAYEMRDLEELGLVGLTVINGSVRLTRNHKLCHISSIDWGRLTQGVDPSTHMFLDNREEQLCPDFCNESCPTTTYQGIPRRRCWTSKANECQRNLVCQCPNGVSCAPDGSCCSEQCLGGCSGPEASDCYVCSQVSFANTCYQSCPYNTYMLSNRRCLTKSGCLSLRSQSRSSDTNETEDSNNNFTKLLVGDNDTLSQCVFKCPPGYRVDDKNEQNIPMCILCHGFCPKVCNTTKVMSIQDSEKLLGCSTIDGNLEIQLVGGNDIDFELTKNLGAIREVTGYIKIWRSYALFTLHFFRDLELIGGNQLVHKKFSLFVADNTDLQEIFPEQQMNKMVIRKGEISFHGNRKLCVSKILSFVKQMNITSNLTEARVDVSNTSNGNLIPCKNTTFQVKLLYKHPILTLEWEAYAAGDNRQLINYIISYKEVTEPVRDTFQGRDACSDNEWITEVNSAEDSMKVISDTQFVGPHQLVTIFKPVTKYAIYVQTSTLPSATVSAMSRMIYFQTSTSTPSKPTNLEVSSSNPHELTVKWNPPEAPNGNVTHYRIIYQRQAYNISMFAHRDFCKEPFISSKDVQKEKQNLEAEKKKKEPEVDHISRCCACHLVSGEDQLNKERSRQNEIDIHDTLLNNAYQKIWTDQGCLTILPVVKLNTTNEDLSRWHSIDSNIGLDFNNPIIFHYYPPNNLNDTAGNDTAGGNNTNVTTTELTISYVKEEMIVNDTMVTLFGLEQFHVYNIVVIACHDTDPVTDYKMCGYNATITGQTAANPLSDSLNSSLVSVHHALNKSGEIFVSWEPPELPNGLILKYYLRYRKVDPDRSSVPVTICVSAKQFHNNSNGYMIQNLSPGNYSLQISAHSLAGNGTYTQEVIFYVPALYGGEDDENLRLIIGISSGIAVLIILIGLAIFCYQRYRFKHPDVIVSPNPHYIPTDQLYAPDEWEVPRDTIRLIKELGQGSFGTVFEGLMEEPDTKVSTPVAVKTVNDKADFYERLKILKEATTMKACECHHVVKLLGVVSKGQPALVIMELMALGDLRNYLRKCRLEEENYPEFFPPTHDQIRQMAGEIADGMVYLTDKKIVHRDLAARNCLVSEDGTVKIADFGMARDVYMTEYYRKDQRALLPVRWMAPESLKDGIFTTMSDIWSYGIVLWEMVTLAEQPYQGLGNDEVLHYVADGRVMNPPHGCPADLHDMMQRCWSYNPKHRPSFKSLLEILVPYLSDRFHEVSYFFKEVVKSEPEDEREEKILDANVEEVDLENDEDDKTEADQDFDGDDIYVVADSPVNYEDDDDREGIDDSPYISIAMQNLGSLSQAGSLHANKKEHLPLLQQQEQFLYPSSVSAGSLTEPGDFYTDDNDSENDSDSDFIHKDDKNYIRSSKDAKSSSERLKLLSDSPGSFRPKLEMLPVKPLSFSAKTSGSGWVDEYALMSPPLSKSGDENNMSPSNPSASSHQPVSNPPPFSLGNLLPPLAPSASPILHVDMEGIGNSRGTNQKLSTAVDMSGHGKDDRNWLFKNNTANVNKSNSSRDDKAKLNDSSSNSNSNSNSIQNSSEGSKESTSSSSSRNGFNPGTANGHGPYSHQQAALC